MTACQLALRDALRGWLEQDTFTHFITLATHDPLCSPQKGKELLDRWGQRMDRAMIGKRWNKRREAMGCEWIAFAEGLKSEFHWHVLFRISPDLNAERKSTLSRALAASHGKGPRGSVLRGLEWQAHENWTNVASKGDAVTRTIGVKGVVNYCTKGLIVPQASAEYVVSAGYKYRGS